MKHIFLLSILFLILGQTHAYAKSFTYHQIDKIPKSVEKDYYIWRFLIQKNTTRQEAKKIIYQANSINKKLRIAYKKKTGLATPSLPRPKGTLPPHIWKNRAKANKYFRKGLKFLQANKMQTATQYFDAARRHYVKRHEKDKTLFWLYMSTKNSLYLKHLERSHSPNMYTLLAADTSNSPYPKTITQRFKYYDKKNFKDNNPITWATIKHKMNSLSNSQISNLADNYTYQESIGIYTYLKAKASDYKKSYFPMPYRDIMKDLPLRRQALIYAIARQESRFVPASVSRSFALGMMQFMPFLIKDIAKKKGYKMDLDKMFNPYVAIEFADYHLDYLNKYLYHPLFVAYAYNGGIGFTKRHILNNKHFRHGKYEPYMSMETMKNVEAREYGKKVLANYIIYLNKLGMPSRISSFIGDLATPSKTDKFRR
ncbi:MAG: Soluble lytic murein transglycosylase precursor (EC [uncultured Sulfurovum sp.]|uniref:Soluble lytic murein transglycosylase (EC) n=1 Tax=uncultured Sulfurovum sp. TaxID=269237 RepID=A0A6S6U0U9_9BACT|nr:MAG: Soluble lytic murein transglycosylase precursor (EC [uncultured Sulfurovum sp.]